MDRSIITDKKERGESVLKHAKKKVSISLDADLVEELKVLAQNDDRTLSRYINKLLRMYVGSKEEHGGTMYFRL